VTFDTRGNLKMQKVSLAFHCKAGQGEALLTVFTVALVETRAFEGCRQVEAYVSQDDPDLIVLLEDWESRAHYEKYLSWRLDNGLMDVLEPILASPLEMRYLDLTSA